MNKRSFYNGYIKGREQAIQELKKKKCIVLCKIKVLCKRRILCKNVNTATVKNIFMKQNAMHIEVRCKDCGKWNKFVPGVEEKE